MKYGKIEITDDDIIIYSFDSKNYAEGEKGYKLATIEAFEWAKKRLDVELKKLRRKNT